jgi:hypothetical protein
MSLNDSNEKSHADATTVVAVGMEAFRHQINSSFEHGLEGTGFEYRSVSHLKEGENVQVPMHIRASSDNPRKILL